MWSSSRAITGAEVDSMETGDITDVVQAVAVVAVAIPAFLGLNTWRDQLIGRKKVELAEAALIVIYELQGVIEWARHPITYGGEGADRPGREEEPEDRQSLNDAFYTCISRMAKHEDTFAQLRTVRMRFRAYFGDQAQDAFATFTIIRNDIGNASGMLMNRARDERYPTNLKEKYEDLIWDSSTNEMPDAIRQRINDAVAEIEGICRPILTKD